MERRGSKQKSAVLRAVKEQGDHPSADSIFLRVRRELPGTSLSTVYRNLAILVDEGMLSTVPGPGTELHYDHRTVSHCHFQCRSCGRVVDVTHEPLETAVHDPVHSEDFIVDGVSVTYTGFCAECVKKQEDGREE